MKRKNIERSRILRRHQTDAENKLWAILRNRQLTGVKFRRQFSIGNYILDFYSPKYKLGIEADGGQHYQETAIAEVPIVGTIVPNAMSNSFINLVVLLYSSIL